jgi:hypothetical protein
MTKQVTLSDRAPAKRMRLHRRRRRLQLRPIRIELSREEIEALVTRGYLQPGDCDDSSAVEFAANAFISDQLMMP